MGGTTEPARGEKGATVRLWTASASTRPGTAACELVIFLAQRLRNVEDEVGVSGEASEAGSSTMATPSGAARMRRPRWREGGPARGTGGDSTSARCWRVSRSWDRGLTRLGRPHTRMGRGGAVRRRGAWRTGARVRRQPAASCCFNFVCPTSK
jgi:hypothetical protein